MDISLSDMTEMRSVRSRVRQEAQQLHWNGDRTEDLVVAACEAMTNGLRHAGEVRCQLWKDRDRLMFRVTDRGRGMPSPELPAFV
ncbi:MAG TPA: ATP-binding protein, partial [Candidatus Xenobia bacterium]